MKRPNRLTKIILALILALSLYSLLPVVPLYIKEDPSPILNETKTERLKSKKGEYFEFIVLSDIHAGLIFDDSAAIKIVRRMNRESRFQKVPIDFVMVTGDLTFRGTQWDYSIYNKIRSLIKFPVLSALGNHDKDNGGEARFNKYIGKREFSFTVRNSYFIVLDNTVGSLTEDQFTSFEEDLKKSLAYKHRFIFMHKSPFASYQQSWYRPELSKWSYRFRKLCEQYKVDMVFCGHEHMFKESNFGTVKYIISGGGGMIIQVPASEGGFLHYTVIKVTGDYIDYEVRKVFPPLWEFLSYYMWKEIFYFLKDVLV